MYSEEERKRVRVEHFLKADAFRTEVFSRPAQMLREDLDSFDPDAEGAHPDGFMLRANQIGIGLAEQGMYALAEVFYRGMLEITLEYRKKTGKWRHVGAIHANIAATCAAQKNLDGAVVELLRAAEDDVATYKVPKEASYAIQVLLEEYFSRPARERFLHVVGWVNRAVTASDVESLCQLLGDRAYALLAYVHQAWEHGEVLGEFPNEFSRLQALSALRSLCCLFEVELKTLAGKMDAGMFGTIRALYGQKGWWTSFHNTRVKKVSATSTSKRPVDDQLKDALGIGVQSDEERFWKSLLVAYIVRNYTVHQLDPQCTLINVHYTEALAHVLNAMVSAGKWT